MQMTETTCEYSNCLVTACFGSEYKVFAEGKEQNSFLAGRFRITAEDYNPLAIGDRVTLRKDKESWLITEIEKRRNSFYRKAPGRLRIRQVLGANIDQVVTVFSVFKPRFVQLKLDTILTAAADAEIPAFIIFNKIDLLPKKKHELWHEITEMYLNAGFPVIKTSGIDGRGLNRVRALLENKISILSGPSGMGKSTIMNALFPGLGLEVKKLARKSGMGKHTTAFSRLFPLPAGGYVGDTPGSRYFNLYDIPSRKLASCFPEIEKKSTLCRFDDCSHDTEPGCAVLDALRKGEISEARYRSFRILYGKVFQEERERGFNPPRKR